MQCSGDETITIGDDGEQTNLRHALSEIYDVRRPSQGMIELFAERSGDLQLNALLDKDDKAGLDEYLYGKDTLDLMQKFGTIPLSAAEFCRLSKPIAARAYSISSCPLVHENEVHATIASVRWDHNGREHKGICSTYLADLVDEGHDIGVYFSGQQKLPHSGRWQQADHYGWPWHRYRAVPRLFGRTRSHRSYGAELVIFRRSDQGIRLHLPRRNRSDARARCPAPP